MNDPILNSFLERSRLHAAELSASTDLVELVPEPGPRPRHYVLDLGCRGLVRRPDGAVVEHDRWVVGIHLHPRYLKARWNPLDVLTLLGPPHAWHPNIAYHAPLICVGRMQTGPDLVTLTYQVWEVITWHLWQADDGLNQEACRWARRQPPERFPVERRPLKWKTAGEDRPEVSP